LSADKYYFVQTCEHIVYFDRSQAFHLGGVNFLEGRKTSGRRPWAGTGNFLKTFCFEMEHFGANVTNAVRDHGFPGEGKTMERLT